MKAEFWIEKWQKGETGFHQQDVNGYLRRFWGGLDLPKKSGVFVPLCGKSYDMLWLKKRSHPVLGVELSELAVKDFFAENKLKPRVQKQGQFTVSSIPGLDIFCGDFFALKKKDMEGVEAVYDRAALIALPPAMRKKYAHHMTKLLPKGAQMLLLTIDYQQEEMKGPPFSVTPAAVKALYGADFRIKVLERREVVENDRLKQRGLSKLNESAFLLVKN